MDYHALDLDDVSKSYNMFSPVNGIDISMVSTQKVQCKIANTITEGINVSTVQNEVRNNEPCVF